VTPAHASRTTLIAQFALLCAIIVLMAFTPLGYLRVGIIEATLLMIPVALGAIRLGPLYGGLLGAVFGATSFAQCFGVSPFGTMLFSIDPLATFVVCLVPRILMGVLVALIYRALAGRHRNADLPALSDDQPSRSRDNLALGGAFASSALLNTILFVTLFLLLFGRSQFVTELASGKPLLAFIASLIGLNGIAELVVATTAGTAIGAAVQRATGAIRPRD